MRGRRTLGPKLVQKLEGSEHAKQRLEVILRTLTGELTIAAASELLGIRQAQFNVVRRRALEAALGDLEPRRRGRPAKPQDPDQDERHELNARVTELEQELEVAAVRTELATILPQCANSDRAIKKRIIGRRGQVGSRSHGTGSRRKPN